MMHAAIRFKPRGVLVGPMVAFLCVMILAPPEARLRAAEDPRAPQAESAFVAVVADVSRPGEMLAARTLAAYLGRLYPATRFEPLPAPAPPEARQVIVVGTRASQAALLPQEKPETLETPGGFVVFTTTLDQRPAGCVVGADLGGMWHGVWRLLERLGCGFYLSFDALPDPPPGEFTLDAWQLADRPLVPVRLVFNWHNFLSGCSAWDLEQWTGWIEQSQKMGYSAVMVHAYGNNPMAGYRFEGVQKPVGYLSSTRVGRDWATCHVSDVRRLWGGRVFSGPVFGSTAAVAGSDAKRTRAAQQLMARAFAFAHQRGVKVYFAVDVDTTSANPQELIMRLPPEARFPINVPAMRWMGQAEGRPCLADPDSAAGYRFYKAQVEHLLSVYPQIDCLVMWSRTQRTPWMAFGPEEMPDHWQAEFQAELRRTPEAAQLWHACNFFGMGKILRAFRRALDELGHSDVELGAGSWGFQFLPSADRFYPPEVKLLPLDYAVLGGKSQLASPGGRSAIAQVAEHRPVIPVAWAHHDDGHYLGRPYTPYDGFATKLDAARAEGFGIIHWTTRPLDLYFESLARQVWASSRDEPLADTCRRMASRCFGPDEAEVMGEYLRLWVTEAPMFGRETSPRFIDRRLADPKLVAESQQKRLEVLERVDPARLSPAARVRLEYFKALERFILDVHQTQALFDRAQAELRAGRIEAARGTLERARPEAAIERFAQGATRGGITRGEQGVVVTLNTRWLSHFVRLRQQAGIEAVRYNLAPTSHDPLAQSPGRFTFHVGPDRSFWECLGKVETGREAFCFDQPLETDEFLAPVLREGFASGIVLDGPLNLPVRPIMSVGPGRLKAVGLPPGEYAVDVLLRAPPGANAEQALVELSIEPGLEPERVKPTLGGPRGVPATVFSRTVRLAEAGPIELRLRPIEGRPVVCGVVARRVAPAGDSEQPRSRAR